MPEQDGFRTARVFDEAGPEGTRRTPLGSAETGAVLGYLRDGKLVLAARSRTPDMLDPERAVTVPTAFRTDGTWIWAEAVAYYLEHRGLAPEDGLLAHIRSRGYQVPEVGPEEVRAAVELMTTRRS